MANAASFFRSLTGYAFRKLILAESEAYADLPSAPTITSGDAAPTAAEPKGSVYTRSGGSGVSQILYVATDSAGTWAPLSQIAGTDTLAEATAGAGVTVDGLRIKDAAIAPAAGGSAFVDLTSVATGEADIILKDDLADALTIREATTSYLTFTTTDSTELAAWGVDQRIADAGRISFGAGADAALAHDNSTGLQLLVADNDADAFEILQATDSYLVVDTTNDAERVSVNRLLTMPSVTTVDMADAAHALVLGAAGSGETKLVGNVVFCDPNSTGASETLTLPAEASCDGMVLYIFNTAGGAESIVVENDATATVVTIAQNEGAIVACDGTSWRGLVGANT